jgi:dihydrofolate reductase
VDRVRGDCHHGGRAQVSVGKTQYYTATSLDGFIADASNGLEWLFQFTEHSADDYASFIAHVGAVVMGSTTYEWILTNQVLAESGGAGAWPYTQPTWVFSSRELQRVPGAQVHFVRGDVRPVHEAMISAAAGRNIWIVGGGDLAGQFHDAGLLDELIVSVASVTLGAGAPLLPRTITTPPLQLTSVRQFGADFAQLTYAVPPRTREDQASRST